MSSVLAFVPVYNLNIYNLLPLQPSESDTEMALLSEVPSYLLYVAFETRWFLCRFCCRRGKCSTEAKLRSSADWDSHPARFSNYNKTAIQEQLRPRARPDPRFRAVTLTQCSVAAAAGTHVRQGLTFGTILHNMLISAVGQTHRHHHLPPSHRPMPLTD